MDNKEEFITKAEYNKDSAMMGIGMVLAGVGIVCLAMAQMKTDKNLRNVAISHIDLIQSHTADHNLLMHLSDGVEELLKTE